jgi:hypothetical protein
VRSMAATSGIAAALVRQNPNLEKEVAAAKGLPAR